MDKSIYDMTSAEVSLFADPIHRLSAAYVDRDLRQSICSNLLQLLRAEVFASYQWNKKSGSFEKPLVINQDPANIQRYESWFQFRDPMTQQLPALGRPALVDEVIARSDLERTAFYNDFLAKDGMSHGVNLFLSCDSRDLCDLRIWRVKGRPEFSDRETGLLSILQPFLRRAFARDPDLSLDRLTERERDVALLIGKGCADKDIARVLDISFTTVRTHVSACLTKLNCSNRSELAACVTRMSLRPLAGCGTRSPR